MGPAGPGDPDAPCGPWRHKFVLKFKEQDSYIGKRKNMYVQKSCSRMFSQFFFSYQLRPGNIPGVPCCKD